MEGQRDILITDLGCCPYCGCKDTMKLPKDEWFTIRVGNRVVYQNPMYTCLNPECGWCWQEGEYL